MELSEECHGLKRNRISGDTAKKHNASCLMYDIKACIADLYLAGRINSGAFEVFTAADAFEASRLLRIKALCFNLCLADLRTAA
ncbi:hypothetical protein PoB_006222900 [Plakobranchus ocellatus]|uniref:Uncharacterized protein n=1 Tax=Plakobranchus ocellatus TaxID=259542 RepID=A0AAV4CV14_9GAST|nr:hypothetical protein PoB_006222900 [Plakobranchus ocellatus]